ncbi:hypothetical protein Esti_002494 [Eimeria stiedai]
MRGAAGRVARDQDSDDSLPLESESSCESLSSYESNYSSTSRTSSFEANPVGPLRVAEDGDRTRSASFSHSVGMDDEPHSHAIEAKPSAINSTLTSEATREGDERFQWLLKQDQQQELLPGLYPPSGKASHTEHSDYASSDAWGWPLQSQTVRSCAYATCTPVTVSRVPPRGTGQAICGDSDGVLVLLALHRRGLCLLRISAPQAPAHPTEVNAVKTPQGSSFCQSRELLTISGDLPFIRRLQGEAALVQIGSETLLLISKPSDTARGHPARLAVHPLSRAMRKYAARMGEREERFHSLGFDELPSWPLSPDETSPGPRSFYGIAVDQTRQAILLFGGASSVEGSGEPGSCAKATTDNDSGSPKWHPLDDLWSFSMSSCAWKQHFRQSRQQIPGLAGVEAYSEGDCLPSWPKAVAGHSMTAWQRNIWMFGGYTRPACVDVDSQAEAAPINDFWCLNLDGGLWRRVPSSGPAPPPRYLHVACMVCECLLLFGGLGAQGPVPVEDTLYAADLSALETAAWARVSIGSASLPPTDYYLGAAPTLGAEAASGAADLIIYGGRSAYVVSARLQAGAAQTTSLEPCTYDEKAPSTADGPLVLCDDPAEVPEYVQDAEVVADCQEQPSLAEAEKNCAKEGENYAEAEASEEQREVCDQGVNRGMQILATLMPGAERQEPDTGRIKSAPTWGLLPQLRSVPEVPCAARASGWHPAFPILSPAAPIIFRARRRGRRQRDSATLEANERAQGHMVDLASSLLNGMSRIQPFPQAQAASQPAGAPQQQQAAGGELLEPELCDCDSAGQSALPSAVWPPAPAVQPSSPPAPDSLQDVHRPLSQRHISTLLSLSHQATVGAAKPAKTGAYAPQSSPPQAVSCYSELLNELRSSPPQTVSPASLSLSNSSLYASPVAGCRRTSDVSSSLTRRAQSSSYTAGDQGRMSPAVKGRASSMTSQGSLKTSREDAVEAALRPKLCRLGSVASRQPYPRLDSTPPLTRGGPQSPQGVEALMRWMDSALETHPSSSPSTRKLHFSFPPGTANQGRSSTGRGGITTAWAAGSEPSPHGINGDAAHAKKQCSRPLDRLPVAPWCNSTQNQARLLASMVYSSQLPNELPQRKASFERKALPPLPIKSGVPAQGAAGSRSKSMVVRRVSQLAFAAESNGEEIDDEPPLPRPARRLKSSASNTRKSGCTLKPRGNAGGASQKAKFGDTKPTPPLVQARQAHRLVRPTASLPPPGRPRSTGQGNSAYDRPVSVCGRRKVTRRDEGETVSRFTLRKSSSRKTSLPSSVIDEQRPMHAPLLRRITGWPAEAIAAFFLAKSTPPTQRGSKSRSSSASAKPKNARKR